MMQEFVQSVAISLSTYAIGALLYEKARCHFHKWIARTALLWSLLVMIAFGFHSVRSCETALQLLATQQHAEATKIAETAPTTDYQVTLSTGTHVKWSKSDDGRHGPMSVVPGRSGAIGRRSYSGPAIAGRSSVSVDGMRDGAFWGNDADGANAIGGTSF